MKKILVITAAVLALALSACVPQFPAGATLTAENVDPYVVLNWTEAAAVDEGATIASYQIDVDGAHVSLVGGWATGCVLKGLANSTNYTITVSAIDSLGQVSSASGNMVTTSHTTQTAGDAGSELFCDTAPPPDM